MTRRSLVTGLYALWAAIFAGAFLAVAVTEPTGEGFVRGLNRVTAFLGWQIGAGALALVLASVSRKLPPGRLRQTALMPLGLFVAGALALAALIVASGPERADAPTGASEVLEPVPE